MSEESILARLIEVLRESHQEIAAEIGPETRLYEIAEYDSLAMVEYAVQFEDEFRVRILDDSLTKDVTLAQIARSLWEGQRQGMRRD